MGSGNINSQLFPKDIFRDAEHLISLFEQYITWVEVNTLKEYKIYGKEGDTTAVPLMRMPTLQGFGRFLRTPIDTFGLYRKRGGDFEQAIDFIEESLYAISIEGAAAGLLREAIVAKKLGLADKVTVENTQRRIVIMHTPDNGRSIDAPEDDYLEIDEE